jgi:hypothetical protein
LRVGADQVDSFRCVPAMSIAKKALELVHGRGSRVYGTWARDAISETEIEVKASRQEAASLRAKLSQATEAAKKAALQDPAAQALEKSLRAELSNYKEKIVPTLERELAEARNKLATATAATNIALKPQPSDLVLGKNKYRDSNPVVIPAATLTQQASKQLQQDHKVQISKLQYMTEDDRPVKSAALVPAIQQTSASKDHDGGKDDGIGKSRYNSGTDFYNEKSRGLGPDADFYSLLREPMFMVSSRSSGRTSLNPNTDEKHWTGAIR